MKFYQQEPHRPYHDAEYSFFQPAETYPKQLEYTDPFVSTHQSPFFHRQDDSPTFRRSPQSTNRHQRSSTEPVWEQLYQEGMKSKQELIERHEEHKAKMDEECTFRPTLSGSTRFLASSNSTFLERMAIWQENKLQKIIRQKQEQTNKDLKECTFTPKLFQRKHLREISPQQQNRLEISHHKKRNRDINPYYSPKRKSKAKNQQVKSPENKPFNASGSSNKKNKGLRLNQVKEMLRQELKRMAL